MPNPDPIRKGGYIVEGDLLLTDFEWAGGLRPSEAQLIARRKEIGEATAQADAMPEGLAIAVPAGYEAAMAAAEAERQAQLLKLAASSPLRAARPQEDLVDGLFGTGTLL